MRRVAVRFAGEFPVRHAERFLSREYRPIRFSLSRSRARSSASTRSARDDEIGIDRRGPRAWSDRPKRRTGGTVS